MACSGWSLAYHTCSILTTALAIAIIIIVAVHLTDKTSSSAFSYDYVCLLGADVGSSSLCTYTYVVSGVSLAVSAAVSLLECCTCNLCGLGKVLDLVVAGFGAVWWGIAAGVIGSNTNNAQVTTPVTADVQNWRDSIPILAYIETGLFVAVFIAAMFRVCKCCLG